MVNIKNISENTTKPYSGHLEKKKNVAMVAEKFHHNDKVYKIMKIYPDFNKPFGIMRYTDGIYFISINGNATEEENRKELEYLLNLDNPLKSILKDVSLKKLSNIMDSISLGKLQVVDKLPEYIGELIKVNRYDQECTEDE